MPPGLGPENHKRLGRHKEQCGCSVGGVFLHSIEHSNNSDRQTEALSVRTCGCVCTHNSVVQVYTVTCVQCRVVSVVSVVYGLGMVMYRVA